MRHMSIDIETYSDIDIKKAGMYKYVESPAFEIMLIAYSIDDAPVRVLDLTGLDLVDIDALLSGEFYGALLSPDVIKHAYNAAFEWWCLSKLLRLDRNILPLDHIAWLSQWRCTMLHGLYCGYPMGLDAIGKAFGLPADRQKLGTGKALIKTFCTPCTPSKANGQRTRTKPFHEPEKWALFKEYNRQDVIAEMEIERRLSAFPVPDEVQKQWELDQQINSRGVAVDWRLVSNALLFNERITDSLKAEATDLTGLDNPNSVAQLISWYEEETGEDLDNLRKDTVKGILSGAGINSDTVRRVLQIRQELSKTSVKKYDAMREAVCADSRIRGLLQFYGANRTGRWAGRLVQVQNLPQNKMGTLSIARRLVRENRLDDLRLLYGNIPDTLSQLIRTAFVPTEGHTFLVADFSAIEARVIAWLAGEQWRMDVFRDGGDIYCASASQMFHVPVEKGGVNGHLRQKGKVAELALGYQGAAGALIKMGALEKGLTEDELPEIVSHWRKASPNIVQLWYDLENAAIDTLRSGIQTRVGEMTFAYEGDYPNGQSFLTITLPSGRKLFYVQPFLSPNRWGKDSIHYYGMDQTTKKWGVQDTYGGKLAENITQAVARDCLSVTINRLEALGYPVVMHVHDEAIIDIPADQANLDLVCDIMGQPIPWAPGLLLRADGFKTEFYRKD